MSHADGRRVQGFTFPRRNIGSAVGWYRNERVEPGIKCEFGLMAQRLLLSLPIDLAYWFRAWSKFLNKERGVVQSTIDVPSVLAP